jgi:hypothetical protein
VPPSTARLTDDWFSLPEPVSLTAAARRACAPSGGPEPESAGAAKLRYALWRFYLARTAGPAEAQFMTFRVPVEIRAGVWKRVALFAYREAPFGGWTVDLEQ